MACANCENYMPRIRIGTPEHLTKAINLAKIAVDAGVLAEIPHDGKWGAHFSVVDADGPWDDIMVHGFTCNSCGQEFRLSAETYRGRGGSWEPVLNEG